MTADLGAFLQARYDEDEAAARVATPGPWGPSGKSVIDGDGIAFVEAPRRDAAHIARHDPARVLRGIEAKRRVVGRINSHAAGMGVDEVHGDVLRALAAEYADHPDFDPSWSE
ncbi:DUF6221 family protein [Streptomyces sp. NBC_01716]|uniref:DUF6221 family protein n=1 Tax=Streptomyces sp. NBC_01716 TaxID=2975917 RepID=UPI002E369BA2|nr:DUF6221 family protein [Streptomyces sp. NBC_01716]